MRALRSIPGVVWLCALVAFLNGPRGRCGRRRCSRTTRPSTSTTCSASRRPARCRGPGRCRSPRRRMRRGGRAPSRRRRERDGRPLWTEPEAERSRTLDAASSRVSDGADAGVGGYPPLYYAALGVPYKLAVVAGRRRARPPGRDAARLRAVRGLAALFVTPVPPRAASAAPLGVGPRRPRVRLMPYFAYLVGLVQPRRRDPAASAALFYFVARAFRVGLTPGVAAGLGLAGRRVPDQAVVRRADARGGARRADSACCARRRSSARGVAAWRSPPRAPRCR